MREIHISTRRERLHGLRCPVCGASAEGLTGVGVDQAPVPTPGSFSICASCTNLLVLVESFASYRALSLRVATNQEEENMRRDPVLGRIWTLFQKHRKNPQQSQG